MTSTLSNESHRIRTMITGHVVPETEKCIQCGICSFNCPIGIDVRLHAWNGEVIEDPKCLTCGECIERCPRAVLQFEITGLFTKAKK
jgi:NAD-dependent dihydropyrimidine dehydrogenase PreA subunit